MTTAEAATLKGISRNSVIVAIKRGELTAVKHGRDWWVEDDAKFRAYTPTQTQSERIARRWAKERARAAQPITLGAAKGAKAKAKKGGKKA